MIRTCIKCDHLNHNPSGEDLEACPACGAIYSRVEQALARGSVLHKPVNTTASQPMAQDVGVHEFADILRRESLYPTFRSLVRIGHMLGMVIAALFVIGGGMALISGYGTGRIWGLLGGVGVGAVIYVFTRLMSELSLMLADLSDASVRSAAKLDSQP